MPDERSIRHEPSAGAHPVDDRWRADAALLRAIYLLDRAQAEGRKVRAFQNAREIVGAMSASTLREYVDRNSLTTVAGIGPSTATVIRNGVLGTPCDYLARLERESVIPIGEGAALRASLRGDLHTHTNWSDGGSDIRTMATTARDLGHEYYAITDHSVRLTIAHGLDEQRLSEQLTAIAAMNEELAPFRILTGMEVDILEDGALDLAPELLAALDVVVASVHSKLAMPQHQMTRRMVKAVSSPHVDVLGHCTGRLVVGRGREQSSFDADAVFGACAASNTAVEINCRPERQDPPEELLTRALELGCRITIDTDAHAPGQLEWLPFGCDKAARLDVEPELVLNAWPVEELLALTRAG
jgi:putative hydrolase